MLARAVARIFHGIGTIAFPAVKWRDSAFWARYRQYAFGEVRTVNELFSGLVYGLVVGFGDSLAAQLN